MWDLPGPGLEPVSPALVGGFLTTVPPGKSFTFYFKSVYFFPSPLGFELFKDRDSMSAAPSRYPVNICQMKE